MPWFSSLARIKWRLFLTEIKRLSRLGGRHEHGLWKNLLRPLSFYLIYQCRIFFYTWILRLFEVLQQINVLNDVILLFTTFKTISCEVILRLVGNQTQVARRKGAVVLTCTKRVFNEERAVMPSSAVDRGETAGGATAAPWQPISRDRRWIFQRLSPGVRCEDI